MNRRLFALVSLVMALSMVLTACAQPAPAPAATQPPQIIKETVVIKETVAAPEPTALPDRVQIYWYIGLGAGAQKDDIPKEKAFCDKFNASQHEIQLIPVVVDNNYARDNLKAQIAAGNAPDIVGPVGKKGRGFFPGAFVDLMPLINEFKYDLSDVDQKFLDFYKDEGKVVGLPFAIFPSFTYYNKALFDEAKLPYPPEKYGEKYDGREWNMDTVRDLAMKLTVDANGNDATDPAFDPKNIVQYGLEIQWTDARGYATAFGGGALVDDKGNAQVPEHWKAAWEWMYKGMWTDHCIPTQAAVDSDLMGGNPFGSGVVGMAFCHLWFAPCCIPKEKVKEWGIAAMPSYNGTVTAKLHGDTFSIMAGSKHPKEAFKVLSYMLGEGSADLYAIYGGMPARKAQQAAFFEELSKTVAPSKPNWQVALDSIQYFDDPNHEAGLPNYAKADEAILAFGTDLRSTPNLDVAKRIDDLKTALDAIYKEK